MAAPPSKVCEWGVAPRVSFGNDGARCVAFSFCNFCETLWPHRPRALLSRANYSYSSTRPGQQGKNKDARFGEIGLMIANIIEYMPRETMAYLLYI